MHDQGKNSLIRKVFIIVVVVLLVLFILACCMIWQNNWSVEPPSTVAISGSLEESIQWLFDNRMTILQDGNPMLWWMVGESAKLTGDARLRGLFEDYESVLKRYPDNVWHHIFNPASTIPVRMWQISGLPDYNIYFLYGLTCDEELAKEEVVRRQSEVGFCDEHHPISPACVTHQLMGVRFMQRRKCGNPEEVQRLIEALQKKIVQQLTWDTRVVDVYIQRVLMLTESGARERVKPVWLKNILERQLKDGGWSDFDPIAPVGSFRYLGFTGRGIGIRNLRSGFHATAQGVFLMSLLSNESKE